MNIATTILQTAYALLEKLNLKAGKAQAEQAKVSMPFKRAVVLLRKGSDCCEYD